MRYHLLFKRAALILLFLLTSICGFTQIGNVRTSKIVATNDSLQLDSLSIMPGSLIIISGSDTIPNEAYQIDELSATLIFKDTVWTDTLICTYRVLPSSFRQTYQHKDQSIITSGKDDQFKPYVIGGVKPVESIFDDKGIQKSGSVSRGILFGNSQNLSVNSTLSLQLSGKVSDRYSIMASVTDDNIPIQPDGNTQQLQDFDQVFIQLYDDHSKLIAGDFQLQRPAGYFMNYFKRAQGAYYNQQIKPKDKNGYVVFVEASASVSKGRFSRNVIQGIEGNQGPYRLRGADNELFIIVLAGTEQVYIDGKLLQRGQDKDYVIDYNASEITFTTKQLITKDRRIVVEFQYSEKRYARPLLQSSIVISNPRNKFFLNAYSENDAKNQPLQQDLTDEDKLILSESGDDFLSAYRSGIDSVGYNNSNVLYAITDSLGFDSVFVYATDSSALYRVSFSYVGLGNGDYLEDGFTANGKKYKWIAPSVDGGITTRQGSYAPVVLLTAPKKTQMISTGAQLALNESGNAVLNVEGAMSNKDLNTFSGLDNRDDIGFAFRTSYKWNKSPKPKEIMTADSSQSKYTLGWNTDINYEYTGQYFSMIERFREVEFSRNWNTSLLNPAADQHISSVSTTMISKRIGSIQVGGEMFNSGSQYMGIKGKLNTNISTKRKFKAVISSSYLNTDGVLNSQFLRHKSHISQEFSGMKIYFKDEHENNLFYRNNSDTLTSATYRFYDYEAGIGTADTTSKSITIYYRERSDWKPMNDQLSDAAKADQYGATVGLRGKKDSRLNINVSNRRLRISNPELISQQPENTLLTRIEYSFKLKNGFIQNTTFYEIGAGQEQKREFIYLEVPAGQGAYVWNDYNNDGIRDLNEFEIAKFGYEANFVRSTVQSNEYIRTYTNQFTQSLGITPSKILGKNKKWHVALSRFTDQATLRMDRKTTHENKEDRYNPFILSPADTALLAFNGLFRNILFFNKADPKFGLDYTYQYGRNKNLLSNGFESRGDDFNQLGLRWNFFRQWTFFMEDKLGKKIASSDFLTGRNYELIYFSVEPKLTWQPDNKGRLNLLAQYAEKNNRSGDELVVIRKLGADFTLNSIGKGTIRAEINYFLINYNGVANNSLGFEMLEGLNSGNNFTWTIGIQRTVAKNLQLNLTYNGRKPEGNNTIHSGGVQVRALF